MSDNNNVIVLKLYREGFAMIPSGGGKAGKSPLVPWGEYQKELPSEVQIEEWLKGNHSLWGMVTGEISGVVVVDTDPGADLTIMDGLEPHVTTPRGGFHYYFEHPGYAVKTAAGILPHIDIRGDGGFVNVVGKNKLGEYNINIFPAKSALIPWNKFPKQIIDAMSGNKLAASEPDSVDQGKPIPEGKRNSYLASLGGAMRRKGATYSEIKDALIKANQDRCIPPLPESEVQQIVKSVSKYEPSDNTRLTDTGNAELLAELYGDVLRYDHKRRRWLQWSGHYWKPDKDGQVSRLAIEAARIRFARAAAIEDPHLKERFARWAIQSENRAKIDAELAMASRIFPFADKGDSWDKDTMLLAAENGIVDLFTGELKPGKPEDRITMSVGFDFDPEAKCPRWEQFLVEIFDDPELIDWIWRVLGYTITGDTTEHIIMIGFGEGANGKSKFCNAIYNALGDYAHISPFSTFSLQSSSSSNTNDLAAMELKRFVISSETNAGTRLNVERIKALSGEDAVSARFLYHEFETFIPHLKVWLFVNHKPDIDDETIATWRRVRLIPFTKTFIKKNADQRLGEKLRAEAPGILAWLVRGCLEWQKRGLAPVPECIREATSEYRKETDPVIGFLDACCVIGEGEEIKAGHLYEAFRKWAGNDSKRLSQTAFGKRLSLKFTKREKASGYYYQGIGLKGVKVIGSRITGITIDPEDLEEEAH